MANPGLQSHPLASHQNFAIIVAGGSGSRMASSVPKQFLLLAGRPVMMHTIEAFYHANSSPQIIAVIPNAYHSYWEALCVAHDFIIPHLLVSGGTTRFESVKNGLDVIEGSEYDLVAVHDAVRPLTKIGIIDTSFTDAATHGNAVAAVKSRDTIRQVRGNVSAHMVRDEIYLVQTPQTFQLVQLKIAYQQPYSETFTDDASVVESAGFPIRLIEGSHDNIKITFPEDLKIAELLLSSLT